MSLTHQMLLVIPLLCTALASCSSPNLPPAQGPVIQPHREPSLDGRMAQFPRPGHVTLVDFWATSCEPCKRMMPAFEHLWKSRQADGLDIIGVASDDNPGLVVEHLSAMGVTYPNVVDASGALRGDFHVGPVPHSVVIDREGRVRLRVEGGKPEDLQRVLDGVNAVLEEGR